MNAKDWYNNQYQEMFRSGQTSLRPIRWYSDMLKLLIGKRPILGSLLDVGCGLGELVELANSKGIESWGIDISDTAIEKAELQRKFSGSHRFQVSPAEHLTFPDNSFNYIACLGSLEHFENMHQALDEMKRVAKPYCRFLIIVPNKKFPLAGTEQQEIKEALLTKELWQIIIHANGFNIIKIRKDYGLAYKLGKLAWLGKLLFWLLPLDYTYQFVLEMERYK